MCMFLLMRIAIIGLRLFIVSLKFFGPSPFNPVAFDGSKALCMIVPAQMSQMEY